MCGICGIFHYRQDDAVQGPLVRSMAGSLRHRGPDDEGFLVEGPIGLGFRRLAIIDLETGHQPIPNEDASRWVILNGEIYNYRDLRAELEAAGHRFRTRSDTETLVHGHEAWGADVTNHLNGIFGFAVWDATNRSLLLARDHLGVKPLYWYDDGQRLLFASEIKAILQDPQVPRELEPEALGIFLSLGFVPSPRTLFKGIRKLPPGHRLEVDRRGVRLQRYWHRIPRIREIREEEAIETYAQLFQRAVHRQMVSDVPVGSLLSGGVDSAMVTAVMRRHSPYPVTTFSIGFEEEGDWNELDDAAETARFLGTSHEDRRIRVQDYLDFFPQSLWFLEEPVLSQSTFAFFSLTQLARQKVKVVLTGQGADEPWAGYDRYRGEKLARRWGWLAGSPMSRRVVEALPRAEKLRRAAHALGERDPLQRFSGIHALFTPELAHLLLRPELQTTVEHCDPTEPIRFWQKDVGHLDGLSQLLYIDTRLSLPDDLLFYGDKLAMANSLEARVPILDVELVEFVESLPPSLKLRGMTGKYAHKKAARRWLPESIVRRRKKGFATPVDGWFQNELDHYVRDTLLGSQAACREYFRPDAIETLLQEHRLGRRDHRRRIFALLSFELWHRRFLQASVLVDSSPTSSWEAS